MRGKLKHLGVPDFAKRSSLAYANVYRPRSLYQGVLEKLLVKCHSAVVRHGIRKKFRCRNRLVSLHADVSDLSLWAFDWPKIRRTKGAVKIHLHLEHDG